MYTQVSLRVQFITLCFSPCILSLCLPLSTQTIIHHSFSDDLYLQMSARPDKISELIHSMQSYIGDVKSWATANMLKINDNKTKFVFVTSNKTKYLHNLLSSITISRAQIPLKQTVKNFGFTVDCSLTMNAHVSNIARTCYFASTSVWNSIPNDVRCAPSLSLYKSRLKAYLFRSVYKD